MMMITYHQGDIRPKGEFRFSVGGRNRGNWRPALPMKIWSKGLLSTPLKESFHFTATRDLSLLILLTANDVNWTRRPQLLPPLNCLLFIILLLISLLRSFLPCNFFLLRISSPHLILN